MPVQSEYNLRAYPWAIYWVFRQRTVKLERWGYGQIKTHDTTNQMFRRD